MMPTVLKMLRRLRDDRGQAALETIICVPVLLAMTIGMVSIMILIYNQSALNGGAQMASQAATLVHARETYSISHSSSYPDPQGDATAVARSVLAENTSGMIRQNVDGNTEKPAGVIDSVQFYCAPETNDVTAISWNACSTNGSAPNEWVRVTAHADDAFWLLQRPLDFVNRSGRVKTPLRMDATGDAFTIAPPLR